MALTGIGKLWMRIIGLAFGYGLSANIADAYLRINSQRKADITRRQTALRRAGSVDEKPHNSLTPAWWIAEIWPKIASRKNLAGEWKKYLRLNLARGRWIAPGSHVHESVEQRLAPPM
jgi:hypothetical protein